MSNSHFFRVTVGVGAWGGVTESIVCSGNAGGWASLQAHALKIYVSFGVRILSLHFEWCGWGHASPIL